MKNYKIKHNIFGNIFLLSNKFSVKGDLLIKEMTLRQWMLLLIICKDSNKSINITQNHLAKRMGITRQSIKK